MSIYTDLFNNIQQYIKYDIPVFKPTRLYVKRILRDNNVYLYYFGKSSQSSIETYTGSGKIWLDYVSKYGKDSIEHVWNSDWYDDPLQIQLEALKFSLENNIIQSSIWANSQIENGLDGGLLTEVSRQRISLKLKGIKRKIGSGTSNKMWINNSHTQKCVPKSDVIPKGWYRGMLKK